MSFLLLLMVCRPMPFSPELASGEDLPCGKLLRRGLSDLPFNATSQSLPVGCHIDDPARQLLHLAQDVLAQMLSHQPGQARFVTLQGRSTPLEFWNQACQFPALGET